MKPSDIIKGICDLSDKAILREGEAEDLRRKAHLLDTEAEKLWQTRDEATAAIDAGKPWEQIEAIVNSAETRVIEPASMPLRLDGTPKAKPGRKPKVAAVDQDANSADIAKITSCLAEHGPLTPGSLILLSGVDAVTINKHAVAAAIIESFVDSDGVILVRLISQRPQA